MTIEKLVITKWCYHGQINTKLLFSVNPMWSRFDCQTVATAPNSKWIQYHQSYCAASNMAITLTCESFRNVKSMYLQYRCLCWRLLLELGALFQCSALFSTLWKLTQYAHGSGTETTRTSDKPTRTTPLWRWDVTKCAGPRIPYIALDGEHAPCLSQRGKEGASCFNREVGTK